MSLSGMVDAEGAVSDPMNIAAANWVATSQIASAMSSDCIMVDVGSTTTDIIPIKDGFEAAKGRNDLERLGTGELVYTGTLRSNVATIVDRVPWGRDGSGFPPNSSPSRLMCTGSWETSGRRTTPAARLMVRADPLRTAC